MPLDALTAWLCDQYGLTRRELLDVLMLIVEEASDYTALLNDTLQAMLREASESPFARRLEEASGEPRFDAVEYYRTAPVEEMIPFFSQKVLEVHLVRPYQEALARRAGEAGLSADTGAPPQALASSLFE